MSNLVVGRIEFAPRIWRVDHASPLRVLATNGESAVNATIIAELPAPSTNREALADARLIAAAPDLLAIVKDYLGWGPMTGSDRDLFDERCRAAIAKVEGTECVAP